jgi:hypothetical protein
MQLIKIKHLRPRPLDLGEYRQGLGQREGIVQRNGPARPHPCWKVGGWLWLVLELNVLYMPCRASFSISAHLQATINTVAMTLHRFSVSSLNVQESL